MSHFNIKSVITTIFFQSTILFYFGLNACASANAISDSIIRIKLEGSFSDETILRLKQASTTGFDFDFDAYKIISGGTTPSIYTTIGNTNYAINSIPSFDSVSVIPLGTKILEDGIYTISFESNSSIPSYTLVDKKTGVVTDVAGSTSYSYTGSVNDPSDRFELHFKAANTNPNAICNVNVSSCPGGMFVSLTNISEKEYSIELICSGGRMLKTMVKEINAPVYGEYIELAHMPASNYVVKLIVGNRISSFHVNVFH